MGQQRLQRKWLWIPWKGTVHKGAWTNGEILLLSCGLALMSRATFRTGNERPDPSAPVLPGNGRPDPAG